MKKNVLSLDFGASTVRAIVGKYDGVKLTLVEKQRFENIPIEKNGTLYWDIDKLMIGIKEVLKHVMEEEEIHSIAVDTWGVDFGLLDEKGLLIEAPVHYRDKRTEGMIDRVKDIVPLDELYRLTGNQIIFFNTIFQLMSIKENRPELLERTKHLLLMPDLFNYYLTGEKRAEETIASTTQLFDPFNKTWQTDVMDELGLPKSLFQEIIKPGEVIGYLKDSFVEELDIPKVPVVATTSHDTGSAFVSAPAIEQDFLFVSSGTWSLIGTEADAAIVNEQSLSYNITNESGFNDTTRFLKNVTGLWILQELKREYEQQGKKYHYDEITELATSAKAFQFFIDVDDQRFQQPEQMQNKIDAYLRETNQSRPKTDGEYFRLIYESMALKYRDVFKEIEGTVGKSFPSVYIVGGGSQADILSQMIADSSNKTVVAGPVEATVVGNSIVQLIAQKAIDNIEAGRKIVRNSFDLKSFEPKNHNEWSQTHRMYHQITQKRKEL